MAFIEVSCFWVLLYFPRPEVNPSRVQLAAR